MRNFFLLIPRPYELLAIGISLATVVNLAICSKILRSVVKDLQTQADASGPEVKK